MSELCGMCERGRQEREFNAARIAYEQSKPKERESLEFFKASDFAGFGGVDEQDRERAAHLANLKLESRGQRVYASANVHAKDKPAPDWSSMPGGEYVFQARLIAVEPLRKESEERQLLRELCDRVPYDMRNPDKVQVALNNILERAARLLG